jgi:peptidoglycan/LPS O-acetylase OafA/YrhL
MSVTASTIRVDIQLLRAAAVLSVVVFHFWPETLPSGFAGVDVFFVISGFLITSLIIREIRQTGRVSLVGFWIRRIRRIFPASFATIVVTAGAVLALGSPEMIADLGRHVVASAFSFENYRLAIDNADYFRSASALSPLQHFWSLAVEEQFYLVWPLVVMGIVAVGSTFTRIRTLLKWTIVAVIVASSLLATYFTLTNNGGAYFNTLARAWELGLGALVAVALASDRGLSATPFRLIINRVSWALLGLSFVLPGLERGVPSWGSAPAVILTAIIIATGHFAPSRSSNAVVRGLVTAGRWVGDRSFSMYLWHWPILIIAAPALGRELTLIDAMVCVVVTFVLSDASYRFVETPFRTEALWPKGRPALTFAVAGALSAVLAVGTPALAHREPAQVDVGAIESATGDVYAQPRVTTNGLDTTGVQPFCIGAGSVVFECDNVAEPAVGFTDDALDDPCDRIASCVIGNPDSDITVMYVGDSHGRNLRPGIDLAARMLDWKIISFTRQSCPIVNGSDAACKKRNAQILAGLADSNEIDLVITAQSAGAMKPRARAEGSRDPEADYVRVFGEIMSTGIPLATFRDNPAMDKETLTCARVNFRNPNECAFSAEFGFRNTDFAALAAETLGAHVIDLSAIYCPEGMCPLAIGGVSVYMDDDHASRDFARTLAPFIAANLAAADLIRTE